MLVNIVAVALIGTIIYIILKPLKAEIALLCSLVTCLIIVVMVLEALSGVLTKLLSYVSGLGVGSEVFTYIIKILGISYVVVFMVDIAEDAGSSSIASKVALAGKVIVASLSLPILFDLINNLMEIV